MDDRKHLESVVGRAVSNALEQLVPDLRNQIVRHVLEQIGSQTSPAAAGDVSGFYQALESVQRGTTQVQILDALIDGISKFAARTALYIVRGNSAIGWRAVGFGDNDSVRNSPVEVGSGLAATAIQTRTIVAGPAEEFTAGFAATFGGPKRHCLACPLVVRDKVVALLYADDGLAEGQMHRPAVEALVHTTGLWLEVFATRKATGPVTAAPMAMTAAASATPAPAPSATAAAEPGPTPEPAPAAPLTVPEPTPRPPAEDEEVHKKAKRFAKLLVDEIKLYNQAKVAEGRENRDLYDRLRDDIEKSRASYDKRFGEGAAKNRDYFNQALIRILGENDPSLFGENFPR